ncbi:MAG: methyltransferase family protein [Candidatus Thorarchaeota archaeon]|jgi:protein-S-isoprenylcysteine O-methyltransferase Ste14
MGTLRYVKGFILEPFLGIVVVPAIILLIFSDIHLAWDWSYPFNIVLTGIGLTLTVIGMVLLIVTTYLFAKYGHGSAAPWDPPTDLVVNGLYLYVRNPMVLGVLFTVIGEVVLFWSPPLFLLFLALWIGNHILFVKGEEPELTRKFGDQYTMYMKNVPRWFPRRTRWNPS